MGADRLAEARNKNEVVQASESEERQKQQRKVIGKPVASYLLLSTLLFVGRWKTKYISQT